MKSAVLVPCTILLYVCCISIFATCNDAQAIPNVPTAAPGSNPNNLEQLKLDHAKLMKEIEEQKKLLEARNKELDEMKRREALREAEALARQKAKQEKAAKGDGHAHDEDVDDDDEDAKTIGELLSFMNAWKMMVLILHLHLPHSMFCMMYLCLFASIFLIFGCCYFLVTDKFPLTYFYEHHQHRIVLIHFPSIHLRRKSERR
jgi:hypothetical protein